MELAHQDYPCLRPVEAIPDPQNDRVILRDPTQLAAGMIIVRASDLFLLAMLDGQHRRVEIQAEFARRSGGLLLSHELDGLLQQLDSAGFLAPVARCAIRTGLVLPRASCTRSWIRPSPQWMRAAPLRAGWPAW
jgi:hypothetical protein